MRFLSAHTRCVQGKLDGPALTAHAVAPKLNSKRLNKAAFVQHSVSNCFQADRRQVLVSIGASAVFQQLQLVLPGLSQAIEGIQIVSDIEGFGQHAVKQGDLVLIHYTGILEESGQVFDSTRGGLKYRDGGRGVYRPLAFQLSGYPQPGICEGLQQAVVGMKIGGQRAVIVAPEKGFGSTPVLAPYAAVPANATLRYDVELVRVSTRGPDAMMKGIIQCSAGGASASADKCANVEPAEFF